MENKTVTRMELAEAVHQEIGLSRNECADLVESVLDEMSLALVRDRNVKITSFGGFLVRSKKSVLGETPKQVKRFLLPRGKFYLFVPVMR